LRWNTIEHAFQAKKIGLVDMDKRYLLSLTSGSEFGKGSGEVARKKRKWAVLPRDKMLIWNKQSADVMAEIATAKYSENPEALEVLKATRNAQLWHIVPRGKPIRFTHLEEIRDQ
jgi:predicted NAD-dependent protein-ADP-ribosyltransferase YbiA (DUF1768 family)